MSIMVQAVGTLAMQVAMEANFAEEMLCFGRALPGGEVHEGPELAWFCTGRPRLNGVTRTHLGCEEEAYVEQKITEVLAFFAARNTRFGWGISPVTRPTRLATFLERRGFTKVGEDNNMAIDIHTMNEAIASPSNLVVREIQDAEMLKLQRDISIHGFGSEPGGAQTYYENFVANGFGNGTPWHHYIGWLGVEPVAMASLLLHAGVAGIYGVATMPQARKQGVGAAMTLHTMRVARTLGYRVAILSPSDMGANVYRAIGFQEVGTAYYYRSPLPTTDKNE